MDEVEDVALDAEDMHGYAVLGRGLLVAGVLVVFLIVLGLVVWLAWGSK